MAFLLLKPLLLLDLGLGALGVFSASAGGARRDRPVTPLGGFDVGVRSVVCTDDAVAVAVASDSV